MVKGLSAALAGTHSKWK